MLIRTAILCAALLAGIQAEVASADPVVGASAEAPKNLVYIEALGKLGVYGVGYERELAPWLSVGAAGSVMWASHRTIIAASPYVSVGTAISGRHRWFAQLGPELLRESEPAVPGFDGLSVTSIGGQLTAGYELRGERWIVRGHGVMTFGKGGLAPWLGASIGLRL